MKHTENEYIQAGYKYEKATGADTAKAHAQRIRAMLQDEAWEDQAEARRLIEQGRREARQ